MKANIQGALGWGVGSLMLHLFAVAGLWHQFSPPLIPSDASGVMQVQILSEESAPDAHAPTEPDVAISKLDAQAILDHPIESQLDTSAATSLPLQEPYLSVSELEQRPYPVAPVVVPYPATAKGKEAGSVTLVLYVAADGKIERIEVDQSNLAAEFERAAIETFEPVQMHPGIKDGRAAKARIKIMVEFESQ